MKNDFFITKYGDRIDFIEGYFDLFSDLVAQYKDTIQVYDNFSEHLRQQGQDKATGNTPPILGAGYLSRHARTAKMIEMLDKYAVLRKFKSVLDIGTGYGIMPRLLKAYGIADKAFGLDLTDRTYFISSQKILDYERDLAWTRMTDSLKERLNFNQTNWALRASQPEFGFVMNKNNFFPKVVTDRIDLDAILISDIYKYEGKHELITSFASLCCFNSEDLMQKVSRLLVDGGIFFVYVNLWWYPINSTTIVGNFPYSAQRLDKDDWVRYAKEFHPEHFGEMFRLYDVIDSKHPTVSNYIETAGKNGLTLLGYERCIHTQAHDPRSRLSPNYLETFFVNSYLNEVLCNIRRFRNDVCIEDLQTSHIFLAFQKKVYRSKLHIDSEFIRKSRVPLGTYGSYTSMKHIRAHSVRDLIISFASRHLPPSVKAKIPPSVKTKIKKLTGLH